MNCKHETRNTFSFSSKRKKLKNLMTLFVWFDRIENCSRVALISNRVTTTFTIRFIRIHAFKFQHKSSENKRLRFNIKRFSNATSYCVSDFKGLCLNLEAHWDNRLWSFSRLKQQRKNTIPKHKSINWFSQPSILSFFVTSICQPIKGDGFAEKTLINEMRTEPNTKRKSFYKFTLLPLGFSTQ